MPPRAGQLDQISEAIGELKGSVKAVEQYVHEGRHGVNNLSQKIDAMRVSIGKDIAAVEAKMDARLTALERAAERETGAKNIAVWFLQSPLIGWLAAGIMLFIAWWKKP